MLERVPLQSALGLEDVVVHRTAIEEPLLGFRDPLLEEVVEAELDGRGKNPVVRPHDGERALVLREVVVAQVRGWPAGLLREDNQDGVIEITREAEVLDPL
eukprot:10171847-Alexandrium_andersonii.AAC.1